MDKTIQYPDLERIELLSPGPQILLGRDIYWTEKRDGSQLRVWLEGGLILLHTRHQEASEAFKKAFWATEQAPFIEQLLREHSGETDSPGSDFNFQPIVFGELLLRGKSPARFEQHETNQFVVFDIFSQKDSKFLPYTAMYQTCYHFGVPTVTAWALTRHTDLESLFIIRDQMLDKARSEGREGVVLKAYGEPLIIAKEKLDIPRIPIIQREMGSVRNPPLPDSELFGAIAKAYADLGENFRDKRLAMPLVAKYVAEEQEKHICGKPTIKLYDAYLRYVADRESFGK